MPVLRRRLMSYNAGTKAYFYVYDLSFYLENDFSGGVVCTKQTGFVVGLCVYVCRRRWGP